MMAAMSLESDYLEAFELHSPEGIRQAFERGASPTASIEGKRPIDILIEMYTRSRRFAECLRVMLDAGATIGDPLLEAVLLDDAASLGRILASDAGERDRRLDVAAAYTCCRGVTALHIAAEFNSLECARALLAAGADVNARANVDANGLGGQTPLFHCVNSNGNYCRPVMELLVEAGADLDLRLRGLIWGENLEWETVVFDVTPMSYAQCGLYRQFHRDEAHVYRNLELLYRKKFGSALPARNVPNRYLFGG